jgi:hypothetical protein
MSSDHLLANIPLLGKDISHPVIVKSILTWNENLSSTIQVVSALVSMSRSALT